MATVEAICTRDMIPRNDQLDGKDDEDNPCNHCANYGGVYQGHSSIMCVFPLAASDHLVNYRESADNAKDEVDHISEADKWFIGFKSWKITTEFTITRTPKYTPGDERSPDKGEYRRGNEEHFEECTKSVIKTLNNVIRI